LVFEIVAMMGAIPDCLSGGVHLIDLDQWSDDGDRPTPEEARPDRDDIQGKTNKI
jgi:hypothetical protein